MHCCSEWCCSCLLWCGAVSLHKVACCLHGACVLQLHGANLGCISQQAVCLQFWLCPALFIDRVVFKLLEYNHFCLGSFAFISESKGSQVELLSCLLWFWPSCVAWRHLAGVTSPKILHRFCAFYDVACTKICGRYDEPCTVVLNGAAHV